MVMGCLGIPNKSSLSAFGWSKWGWSANGSASARGVSKGSGGGQPEMLDQIQILIWLIICVIINLYLEK